jgi:hypothetical protein
MAVDFGEDAPVLLFKVGCITERDYDRLADIATRGIETDAEEKLISDLTNKADVQQPVDLANYTHFLMVRFNA